jgi:hypothetical protein
LTVLLALETNANPNYAERRKICESTWGSRMPAGYFFESFDGPRLGVDDSYRGLCAKTKAICQHARDNDYQWLLVVDDDCFVRTDRLQVPEADYAGFCLPRSPEAWTYCAGSFYWLSRRAFSIVADAPLIPERWTSAEDQWVGWTLGQHGIRPVRLPDVLLEPCPCRRCDPDKIPEEWTSYTMWIRFSPGLFADFEKRYGLTAKP